MPEVVHHQSRKAADLALAKRQISRASYDAILTKEITLAHAKELGRDRGPRDATEGHRGPGTATETARSAGAGHTPRMPGRSP